MECSKEGWAGRLEVWRDRRCWGEEVDLCPDARFVSLQASSTASWQGKKPFDQCRKKDSALAAEKSIEVRGPEKWWEKSASCCGGCVMWIKDRRVDRRFKGWEEKPENVWPECKKTSGSFTRYQRCDLSVFSKTIVMSITPPSIHWLT